MKTAGDHVTCRDRETWRQWLTAHHDVSEGIWLLIHKKDSGLPTVSKNDAIEEAICFGWIDSLIRRYDENSYLQRFTPRRKGSRWSDRNKAIIKQLIKDGRMAEPGSAAIMRAQADGSWQCPDDRPDGETIHPDLQSALDWDKQAQREFQRLAPSYRRHYIGWVNAARRSCTREERIQRTRAMLKNREKPGML